MMPFTSSKQPHRPRPALPPASRALAVLLAFTGLCALSWFAWSALDQYERRLDGEYRMLEARAAEVDARLQTVLRGSVQLLRAVAAGVRDDEPLDTDWMRDALQRLPELRALAVIDADGRVLQSVPDVDRVGNEVSDREYFRVHRDGGVAAGELHVSAPYRSRVTGRPAVAVSQAIRARDGRFAGVAMVAMDTESLHAMLDAFAAQRGLSAVLLAAEGTIVSRAGGALPERVEYLPAPPREQLVASPQRSQEALLPGAQRQLAVYTAVAGSPWRLGLFRDHAGIRSAWQRDVATQLLALLALIAIVLLLGRIAWQQQRALLQSEDEAHALIESAYELVIGLDPEFRIDLFNRRAEEATGFSRAEVLGRPFTDTIAPATAVPDLLAVLRRVAEDEVAQMKAEAPLQTRSGQRILVSWRASRLSHPVRGTRLLFFGRDVTELRAQQGELERQRGELQRLASWHSLLLNSAGQGIFGIDLDGNCTFINPAAQDMLGWREQDVLGRNQHALFHSRHEDGAVYAEGDCPIYQTLRDGQPRRVEDSFIRKDGTHVPVEMTVSPMLADGRLVGSEVMFQDISQRKAMAEELQRLATTDPLTSVANRRFFLHALDLELERVRRHPQARAALLMLDLDHFKRVNDTYGHAGGDIVLKAFADLLREPIRKTDVVGRLGGEEFAVLLPGTSLEQAMAFGERIRERMQARVTPVGDREVAITVSIGVTVLAAGDADRDTPLARADAALYAAKAAGRNRVLSEPAPD